MPDGLTPPPHRAGARPGCGELLPVDHMTAEQKAANLGLVAELEAQLAAFKAELVVGLAADRPASDDRRSGRPGAASGEWAAQLLDASVSEFFPDELALVLNCSRSEATRLWERCSTPRSAPAGTSGCTRRRRAGPVEGAGDRRGTAAGRHVTRRRQVLTAVEATVLPRAAELSVTRLKALARAELIKADASAADARRRRAEREADVTVRPLGDGMSELRAVMPAPAASAARAAADARARELKATGDDRPLGMPRRRCCTT